MGSLLKDIRYGARTLRKAPAFTAVAVLTLALGIGANTAVFSVVNGVLLDALPFPEADRLVSLSESSQETPEMNVAFANYLDWRAQQSVFEEMAARMPSGGVLAGDGEPERITGRSVTASFFDTLGVRPRVGRFFDETEDRPGAERVMVISYGLWQRRFGAEPQIVGRAVRYSGAAWTVVGVMPPGFDFYGENNPNNDFFIPLGRFADEEFMRDRDSHLVAVTARLRPGVSLEEARAEMRRLAARLGERFPESNGGRGVAVRTLLDDYVGEARAALLLLTIAVALVLLIACANVANLMLARGASRRREVALRMALGAGRGRIVRQLLVESLLLAVGGGLLGLLLAAWGVDLLVALNPESLPRLENISPGARVAAFSVLVTALTGVIFGLTPALQTAKVNFHDALREGGMGGAGGVRGRRLRGALVVAQVALSLMLLIGAGLLVRSFRRLMQVEPGFDPRGVLTLRLRLPDAKYPEPAQATAFLTEVRQRVETLPGVRAVSITTGFPLGRAEESEYLVEGEPEPRRQDDWPRAHRLSVDEHYHRALGIGLLAGRHFTARDGPEAPPVAIVDEEFVHRNFAGVAPDAVLGKRLRTDGDREPWREIVGVVRHIRQGGLDVASRTQIYRPWTQVRSKWFADYARAMDLVIKTAGEPEGLVAAVGREVRAVDRDQPLGNVRTLEELLARSVAPRRFNMLMLGLFAALALALAAVGIYGVMSYAVTQRTHEIGVRMALGARAADVLRTVVGQGLRLALFGIGLGLLGAVALTRLLGSLLYDVSATDPSVFAAVSVLLLLVALAACYVPARRATKIDPMEALRYE